MQLFYKQLIFFINGRTFLQTVKLYFKSTFISPPAAFIILVMIILPFYAIFQIISFMMNRWQKQLKGEVL
ncbi:TPA: hypothetical protein QCQ90_005781 [Bacillus cereus]|nr:hypothetical protein [Bacillus cereus]HDR4618083.1 hypothetical protein [Bacillus cereus]HDR4618382.1 hypothetical protein [Bacillus cereus]HDR4623830.1 hypothetical protein [Bacillus cereus]